MILETNSKKINLVLRTRKIVDIANTLKEKNFEEAFFNAYREKDLDKLSKIIYTLAESEDNKEKPFKSSSEVYDFLDEYKSEKGKSYEDIWSELTEVINEEGFFNKKMSKKEISEKQDGLMSSINMNDILHKATENAMSEIAIEEFKGYKG